MKKNHRYKKHHYKGKVKENTSPDDKPLSVDEFCLMAHTLIGIAWCGHILMRKGIIKLQHIKDENNTDNHGFAVGKWL